MNISEALKQFTKFISYDSLTKAASLPQSLFPEEIDYVIPNIVLGTDGPFLNSLFFVSESYICEVRLAEKNQEFDFAPMKSVYNYRVNLSTQLLKVTDETDVSYDTASVKFMHVGGLETNIAYVGEERESWLKHVFDALPLDKTMFCPE